MSSLELDKLTDHSAFYTTHDELRFRDEIGVLPFLPEPEQCQGEAGDSIQYPFVVQEHGTKLGIPIFCWVPILDAAYGVFKDAVRASSTAMGGAAVEWWHDPGIASRPLFVCPGNTQTHSTHGTRAWPLFVLHTLQKR